VKDIILFADTLPSFILKEALKATGFRLRNFHFFRPHQWPRVNLESVGFAIQLKLLVLYRKIFFRSSSSDNPHVFFHTQSEKESDYEGSGLSESLAKIKKSLKLSKVPAHISNLSRNYSFQKKRFFAVGAPGSGNMIFSRICSEILKLRDLNSTSPKTDSIGLFFEKQSLCYMAFVRARFRAALKPFLIADSIGPEGFGHCFYQATVSRDKLKKGGDGEILEFFSSALPLNHQSWANPVHTSHASLSMQDLKEFRLTNTDVIQVVRHPLDNLLSIVSKIAFYSAPSSLALRDAVISKLLNTDPWFYTLFDAIQAYYENICKNRELINIIKYEDLFENPKTTTQKMATYLRRSISEDEASKIFSSLASKSFVENGHRWKPGSDKWKRYIPRKYQSFLDRSNLRKVCQILDYDTPDFSQLPIPIKAFVPQSSNERLALEEIRYYILINKQPYFKHPDIKLFEDPVTGLKVGGLSSHVNAVRKMVENGALF
jgi:hypothetical protein